MILLKPTRQNSTKAVQAIYFAIMVILHVIVFDSPFMVLCYRALFWCSFGYF